MKLIGKFEELVELGVETAIRQKTTSRCYQLESTPHFRAEIEAKASAVISLYRFDFLTCASAR